MTEIVELECPGCGRPLTTDVKECPACHRPVVISSFNSVYSMTAEEVNKYANSFNKALQNNPDNKILNASIAMCYLKLKLYDKALPAFEKAIEDNFDNSEAYFYAAVCLLKGKKAFLAQREEIDKIEKFIGAAITVEPRGVYYLLWAYIKCDYYERKYLKTNPNYKEMLAKAIENGCTQDEEDILFSILDVECPEKIRIGKKTTESKNEKSVEKKSWWTIERIVIVAAASFIAIGLLLMIFCGGKSKTTKSSSAKPNTLYTSKTTSSAKHDDLTNSRNTVSTSKQLVYSVATDGFVNVRQEPNADSKAIGVLATNHKGAELLNNQNKWWKIRIDNVIGYVNSRYVKLSSAPVMIGGLPTIYYVVVSTCNSMSEVKEFFNNCSDMLDGSPVYKDIVGGKEVYKICVNCYSTKSSAQEFCDRINNLFGDNYAKIWATQGLAECVYLPMTLADERAIPLTPLE